MERQGALFITMITRENPLLPQATITTITTKTAMEIILQARVALTQWSPILLYWPSQRLLNNTFDSNCLCCCCCCHCLCHFLEQRTSGCNIAYFKSFGRIVAYCLPCTLLTLSFPTLAECVLLIAGSL